MSLTLAVSESLAFIRNEASKFRFRWQHRLQRYGRAWRYARETLTEDDGLSMLCDAEHVAGIYGLESLSRESVLEAARERWGDVLGLEKWADAATARVSSKWNSDGHLTDAAESWAMDLVKEYAGDDGVALAEIE